MLKKYAETENAENSKKSMEDLVNQMKVLREFIQLQKQLMPQGDPQNQDWK